jgi:hypothetical protein
VLDRELGKAFVALQNPIQPDHDTYLFAAEKSSFDLAIGPHRRHLDTIDRPWQNENVIGSKRRVAAIDGKAQLNAPVLRNSRGVRDGAAIGSQRRTRTRYQDRRHLRFEHILPCRFLAKRDRGDGHRVRPNALGREHGEQKQAR